jgi:hypothetical protein
MPVMPDTRIYGGDSSPQQSPSPFQTLGALMKIKESQLDYRTKTREDEAKAREWDDENFMRDALTRHERPEEAIDEAVKGGRVGIATRTAKDVYGMRTAQVQQEDAVLKNHETRMEQAAQIAASVNDNGTLNTARPQLVDILKPIYGDRINDVLPTEYGDGSKMKQLVTAGTQRLQQIQQSRYLFSNLMDLYREGLAGASDVEKQDPYGTYKKGANTPEWSPNGLEAQEKYRELVSRVLVDAPDEKTWMDGIELAKKWGTPQSVIDHAIAAGQGPDGTWNADKTSRVRNLGMSLKDRAQAEASARSAEIARDRADADEQYKRDTAAWRAGHPPGSLTEAGRNAEEKRIRDLHEEIETWVEPFFPIDEQSYPTGDYNSLPDAVKQEYVKRKIAVENQNRENLQGGLPPLDMAAREASRRGDVAGYDKLRTVYSKITQGLGKLETVVPPPKSARAGVTTPEVQAARKKEMADIVTALADPKLPADKRRELQQRRDALAAAQQ